MTKIIDVSNNSMMYRMFTLDQQLDENKFQETGCLQSSLIWNAFKPCGTHHESIWGIPSLEKILNLIDTQFT